MYYKFINNEDLDERLKDYISKIPCENIRKTEMVSVLDSVGRITSKPVFAKKSSPSYNCAAMDGIAVKAKETTGANEVNPLHLREGIDFIYINTGNPINEPFDAVIMIEDVINKNDGVEIVAPAHPWQHVRFVGEDIAVGEMIVPSGWIIRPVDLAALLSGGITEVEAIKKPLVGIIPTGSELVEYSKYNEFSEDKFVIESNSYVICELLKTDMCVPKRYEIVADDFEELKKYVKIGIEENDILIINAGSSAGSKDYTKKVISELGVIHTHGFNIKPGKPAILGFIDSKPVIGLPGYPVSSYIVYEALVKPVLNHYTGKLSAEFKDMSVRAVLSKRIVSSLKNTEFVRATLGKINGKFIATPLSRGAGATMSMVKADGIIKVSKNREGIEVGEEVDVRLLKPLEDISSKILSIGSHDVVMDLIADRIKLSSAHSGSMGGIMSLRRGECHIAPIHLLDEETGEYNIGYIKKFFSNKKMVLIKGFKRLQGIMFRKGNPKGIRSILDLSCDKVRFVNRQKGSGTRILLDYCLKRENIEPSSISGYGTELITHTAVAVCVSSGTVDAGPGVKYFAKEYGLDFIPLGFEEYDFLTSAEIFESGILENFIKVINDESFKAKVASLEGYETDNLGHVVYIGG